MNDDEIVNRRGCGMFAVASQEIFHGREMLKAHISELNKLYQGFALYEFSVHSIFVVSFSYFVNVRII